MPPAAHVPRKRFGQHFLADPGVLRALTAAIDPRPEDRMVEIGPGLGALTGPLLEHVAHLHAVELDRDLAPRLREIFPAERLTVHQADVLEFDFAALGSGLRVVGNLPYNISTPILFRLAAVAALLRDVHVMLQKEVAERLAAAPGTPQYGRLSVMARRRFDVEKLLAVPPSAFRPPPKVDSAVVRLTPRPPTPELSPAGEAWFAELVRAAFAQRRKTLRNALASLFRPEDFTELDLDPGCRGETLDPETYGRLALHLQRRSPGGEG